MIAFKKIWLLCVFFSLIVPVSPGFSQNHDNLLISKIHFKEKEINELSEIPLHVSKSNPPDKKFALKVDELIDLLEAHKRAAEQGRDIDLLQKKVTEINKLLEERKNGPAKMTINEFHRSLCFNCHGVNDFSPSDRTPKQWRRLIEDDGHAIFENISWDTPFQKNQIAEFLIENAGTYRAEGIGLWQ